MGTPVEEIGRKLREEDPAESQSSYSDSSAGQAQSVSDHQRKFRGILNGILREQVIPRVVDASGGSLSLPKELADGRSVDDIAVFQKIILSGDQAACVDYVQARIDGGTSLRTLCLGLFTTTARELGERWLRDELSFAEVTLGLGSLHILLHQLSARDRSIKSAGARHNIILASAPTEQHAFGILVVSKIFEMEGWLVTGGPDTHTGEDLTSLVSNTWFDIIGLTASSEEGAFGLKDDIEQLRTASLNREVRVMVGGNGFANHPGISRSIGADELANDADDAILKAHALLREIELGSEQARA